MKIVEYLETLVVPHGAGAGKPLQLLNWQRRFLRNALSVEGEVALSIGRGNGKSTLIAAICAAVLDGPLNTHNASVTCVAASFEQSRIVFETVLAFLGDKLDDRKRWKVWNTAQQALIQCRVTGARLKCIGNDARRAHGLTGTFVLDEPAQWPSGGDAMYAAVKTALGKHADSRLIAIGTRPAHPDHFFSKLLDGQASYSQEHKARENDPPYQRKTWKRANPSIDVMPSLERAIRREAKQAKTDENTAASFAALRLNLGTSDLRAAVLVEAALWRKLEIETFTPSGPYALGIDAGTNASLSAGAAYFWESGELDCVAVVPEIPDLASKGRTDSVGPLYERMAQRGELHQRGERVADLEALLHLSAERWGFPSVVVADAWRQAELLQSLERAGFPLCDFVLRRMGWKDGSEDCRAFRRSVIDRRVRPLKSLLMRSAMSSARVESDSAGNIKLSKGAGAGRLMNARDDPAAASLLAVAEGSRRAAHPAPSSFDHVLV